MWISHFKEYTKVKFQNKLKINIMGRLIQILRHMYRIKLLGYKEL
jgi:hypothetical protein